MHARDHSPARDEKSIPYENRFLNRHVLFPRKRLYLRFDETVEFAVEHTVHL